MRIGTNELLIILVVALLIFGPKNLPKLGKMFGKTINGFKKGMEDEEGSDNSEEKTEKQGSKKDEDEEDVYKRQQHPRDQKKRAAPCRAAGHRCGVQKVGRLAAVGV